MSWADSIRSAALAALAARTVPSWKLFAGCSSSWYPHDIWLTRAMPPRDRSPPTPGAPDQMVQPPQR